MDQMESYKNRDYSLDGIRGIACLIVFISHFMQFFLPSVFVKGQYDHFGESRISETPLNIIYNGHFAVMIFFVLSGMVLSMPFFNGKNNDWFLKSLLKRYPRLSIPAFFSTILSFFLMYFIGFHQQESGVFSLSTVIPLPPVDATLYNAAWEGLIGSFFYNQQTFNPVLWTIGIELIGSVLILICTPLLCGTRYRFIFYILGIIVFSKNHLIGFVFGVICADVSKNLRRLHPALVAAMLAIGIYLASYPYFFVENSIWLRGDMESLFNMQICCQALGSLLIIISIDKSKQLSSAFSCGVCRFFGGISYSLYLVHFPILASIGSASVVYLGGKGFPYLHSLSITFAIALLTSIIISYFFKKLVDDKAIIISSKIASALYKR